MKKYKFTKDAKEHFEDMAKRIGEKVPFDYTGIMEGAETLDKDTRAFKTDRGHTFYVGTKALIEVEED